MNQHGYVHDCFSACIKQVAGTGKREMNILPTCCTISGKVVSPKPGLFVPWVLSEMDVLHRSAQEYV